MPKGVYDHSSPSQKQLDAWKRNLILAESSPKTLAYRKCLSQDKERMSRMGKRAHELHPNLAKKMLEAAIQRHPNLLSKAGKLGGRKGAVALLRRRKNDPKLNQKMLKLFSRNGRRTIKILKEKGEFHDFTSKGGVAALKNRLRNAPYIYKAEKFLSKSELYCFKYLEALDVPFIHNFRIENKMVDFFIANELFWEFHPINIFNQGETFTDYFQKRRRLLDENGYVSKELIVTVALSESVKVKQKLHILGVL